MDKINLNAITRDLCIESSSDIAVMDDLRKVKDVTFPRQFLVEGYMLVIIKKGSAKITVDADEYMLSEGDLFACHPRNILENSMMSMDLDVVCLFMTPSFLSRQISRVTADWSFLLMANTREILHVEEKEMTILLSYIELLRMKLSSPMTEHWIASVEDLVQSMGFDLFDIRQRQLHTLHKHIYTSGEYLIQRFIRMLAESSQHGKPYLNVGGYAARLNVSAKYFSAVCKNILGKTALEVINEDIMQTAIMLMHDSSLSIKQISSQLGFANQSHFGTFFRKQSGGVSPHVYRKGM